MSDRDRYLIIPGTSGCKLLDNDIDIGWPAELALTSWLSTSVLERVMAVLGVTAESIEERLSMEFADAANWFPTQSTLRPGGSITPGPILTAAYNQFQTHTPFVYDWRADIRGSGKKLLRFLRDGKPSGGRWRIVGHSQGGLLAVVASKLAAQQEGGDNAAFSQLVSRVALLATPLYGTVSAAQALIQGENLGAGFAPHFLRLVRTWPALHQMLPTWRDAVKDGAGAPLGNLLQDTSWPAGAIDPAMLQRARDTRRDFLDDPLVAMRDVTVQLLMSQAHPTLNHVVRSGDRLVVPQIFERGDTLVPEETYRRSCLGVYERQSTHSIGGTGDTAVHYMLANDPVVATVTRRFLEKTS